MLVLSGGGLCSDIRAKSSHKRVGNMSHDISFVLLQQCPKINASERRPKNLVPGCSREPYLGMSLTSCSPAQ